MRESYDVIVVGAGPAGSTAAYYLARGMVSGGGKRVALLEKATFPRDKYCGDAWCAPALDLLEEMGVLQELEAEGLVRDCTSGGFISPSGESYVSVGEGGGAPGTRCYAIKRIICDERIARRAVEVGASLFENAAVAEAKLEGDGLWALTCRDGRRFRSRMLVAADGAASGVARSLGVVTTPPDTVAARQYVKGGTHNFRSGGVLFYPSYIVPGYVALFRHFDDVIDIGCYLFPGGAARPQDLVDLYENEIRRDPFLQRVLGPDAEFLERVRVASLRTGGVERSTARQFMAVGDAAGQTDPLTGEGIHTGMIGGELAARTIHELFARGDFSEEACASYHRRWMAAFGRDFPASAAGGRLTRRFPLLLDAASVVAQRKGDGFMADFGAAMTGVKPKTTFLRPGVAIPLGIEVVRQLLIQKVLRAHPSAEAAYAARAVEDVHRETAFQNSCLIDSGVQPRPLDERAREDGELEGIFRHAGRHPTARRVLVLYGTEYGFARGLADRVCRELSRLKPAGEEHPLSPRCVSMARHELVDWGEAAICLLICSTAGDGVPPEAARPLFRFLERSELDLSGLRVSVLALGDRAYPRFCRAGHELGSRLRERGAATLSPLVEVDREDEHAIRGWIAAVSARLAARSTWEEVSADPASDGLRETVRQYFALHSEGEEPDAPSRDRPLMARILRKRLLTEILEPSDREMIAIELDVGDRGRRGGPPLVWEPGDALGVIPTNCPEEVAAVLAALGRTGDRSVELPGGRGRVSLREALLRDLDIKRVAPGLLGSLEKASEISEERERAVSLRAASPSSYLEPRELQDVLRDFPAAARALKAEELVRRLQAIRPRYYSISSSARAASDRLSLTVGVIRYELLGRSRTGLATSYLADRVGEGDRIAVFVQRNPGFRLPPEEAAKSCVMIGAGTGAAPYRAFLQELTERARRQGASVQEQAGGEPHLLFFGCRQDRRDLLYDEEWRAWESEGALRLIPAFSRDPAAKIQFGDPMLEHGALLWERIASGGYFYVCGDVSGMAGEVEGTLLEILRRHGGKTAEEARDHLEAMRLGSRLQIDVWAATP